MRAFARQTGEELWSYARGGDSFAAGMMGYLSTQRSLTPSTIKRALAFGTVVASFTISDFSLDGLRRTTREQIDDRYDRLKAAMSF